MFELKYARASSREDERSSRAPGGGMAWVTGDPLGMGCVAIDMLCLLLAWLPVIILNQPYVSPFHRGFYCDDESIQYPLKGSTITHQVLYAVGVILPMASMIVGECVAVRYLKHRPTSFVHSPYVVALYRALGPFLLGMAVSQSFTNVAKFAIGRPRPHFLAVCRPDPALLNCSAGYITDKVCTGAPDDVIAARKSFYSGHASFAMYTLMYLALYVESRLRWRGARILRPFVEFVLVLMAVYVGLSRVSDYKHHWSDVLVGLLQGAAVAFATALLVSDLFVDGWKQGRVRSDASDEVAREDEESARSVPPLGPGLGAESRPGYGVCRRPAPSARLEEEEEEEE
ncbi:phospholipid phosphatase 3-like [Lampetra fluviatilis]